MKIKYSKKAIKFLEKATPRLAQNIKAAIAGLVKTPPVGDIKTLEGFSDDRKRLRYGKYRIIYRYKTDTEDGTVIDILFIMNIGTRGDIYKEG